MTTTALENLLAKHAGAEKDGSRLKLGDVLATFFVSIGTQSMTISKVVSVELEGDLATFSCAKGDVYAVGTADIVAIHFEPKKAKAGLV